MEALRQWFLKEKRDLPWRQNPSSYHVWISEVMLQQTQVKVVIPYYERWMQQFPTIISLANASIEEVIKAWEGLGYYARARNLHEGAKKVVQDFGGELPNDPYLLEQIKGFGPYTVGAILSFAFHRKAAAVDGNVVRVVSRLFAMKEDINNKKPYQIATLSILPDYEPWVVMEGLIELGATICQKKPHCYKCPLQDSCKAYNQNIVHLLPIPKKRAETTLLKREVAVITDGYKVLIKQEKLGKVMAGLYEFPYISQDEQWPFNFMPCEKQALKSIKHGFTRYQVTLYPSIWLIDQIHPLEGYEWIAWDQISSKPFSAGHRRVLLAGYEWVNLHKK